MAKSNRSVNFQRRRAHRNGDMVSDEESSEAIEITTESMNLLINRKRSQTVRETLTDGERVLVTDGRRRCEATVTKSGKSFVFTDPELMPAASFTDHPDWVGGYET